MDDRHRTTPPRPDPARTSPTASETSPTGWTITQAAAHLGLDPDTLRFYERRHIVPNPGRGPNGHRRYTAADIHLLEVLMHLKDTGMPLADIAQFTRLVATDPAGVPERLALLTAHRDHVHAQLAAWTHSLNVINQKITDYTHRLDPQSTDDKT